MFFTVLTTIKTPCECVVTHSRKIWEQTGVDLQHLIIDGSVRQLDEERELELKRLGSEYHWIPDQGLYEGLNNGLKLMKGDYLHVLNLNDSYTSNGILSEISHELKSGLINSFAVVSPERGAFGGKAFPLWRLYFNQKPLPHPGVVLHRELVEAIGNFNTNYKVAGDSEYLFRGVKRFALNCCPQILVIMEKSGLSGTYQDLGYQEYYAALKKEFGYKWLFSLLCWLRRSYRYVRER